MVTMMLMMMMSDPHIEALVYSLPGRDIDGPYVDIVSWMTKGNAFTKGILGIWSNILWHFYSTPLHYLKVLIQAECRSVL